MSQEPCRIVLGERWTAFAQEREGMHMLGTVQRGMQIGALARLADGSYAQVNGDVVEVINKSRVEFALRAATGTRPGDPIVNLRRPPASAVPVVIKKRRRIVLPPEA
jgi:hypothetical protein